MIKYCFVKNEEKGLVDIGVGCNDEYYIEIGMVQRDVEKSEKDGKWYLTNKCPHYTQEEIEQMQKDHLANLRCTKRVFALGLQQLGITYNQLKQLIATNEQAQLEWDLCVELLRSNPLIDLMCAQLEITSEQIDYIFKKANGEIE